MERENSREKYQCEREISSHVPDQGSTQQMWPDRFGMNRSYTHMYSFLIFQLHLKFTVILVISIFHIFVLTVHCRVPCELFSWLVFVFLGWKLCHRVHIKKKIFCFSHSFTLSAMNILKTASYCITSYDVGCKLYSCLEFNIKDPA